MRADNAGTLTYDNDWNFGTTLTGFTFGKNTNTLDLNYNGTLSVAGPIAVYGGNININENLNTVAGGTTGTILLKSSADIILAASKSITTSGASVILWANSDNASSNGSIALRNASSIVTGSNTVAGGHIWIGGGSNGTTWNGLAVGSGYAVPGTSFTPSNGGSSIQSGIYLERNSISSFGGNIKIAGDGAASARGIVSYGNTITINAGSGKIEMDGQVTSAAAGNRGGILLGLHENTIASTVNISSSSTTGDAITLTGVGRGTEDAIGLSGTLNIISSGGGNIVMNGNALGSGRSIVAGNYYHGIMNVFANSGNITLNGNTKAVAVAAAVINGLTSGPSKINIGQGGSISSSSSNVVLTADNIAIAAGGIAVNTSGSVTIEPSSNSFTNPLAFPITDLSIANTITGLTLGKSTNTASITVSSAQSIAGPINIYGGAIALNAGITTTNDTTGNILLNGTTLTGTGNISLAAGRTATINISAASTYEGIISGTGSGLTKSGAGLLTLTKDHTYSGTTTISAGDLQVGTGGSVSQASSGTISNTSGVAVASGCKVILTPNENIVFAAPISGAGGVEIKGASGSYYNTFLTGTAATIDTNSTVLEVLTRITGGLMDGLHVISGGTLNAAAYVKSYNAATNSATLQFQQYDGVYTKSVFAQLTQSGTNVQIRGNTSIYGGAAYRNGNTLGADMSTGSTAMGLATSSGGSGYGISKVYMSGKVNFTGVLTYTGNTTLSNTVTNVTSPNTYSYTSKGTQEITDASSSFPSTSTVVNNGLVILNRSTALTIASNMSGTEEVLQVGAAITFTGTNTYSGNTTIDLNKSLIIGSGGTSGSMTGNIINYGTLSFNRSDSSSYTGIVSGTGTLSKSGSGDLTLTGLNTYTGASTINAGRLILQRDVPATSSSGYSGAGTLVIQPNSSSFTSTVSYPIPGFTVSSSIGGLTIGKTTNTANISVTASTTTAGPMTMYGGNISLAVGVELFTTAAGGNVSLLAKSGFTTAANSGTSRGRIMTTGGGKIAINADADGNNVGELDIDWLTIDGGTGNVSMEAATFNWNTSSGVVYPEFYGTGALTFRGGASSTHPLNLGWIALFQNKSALTIGNPSNTAVVDINPCSNCNSTAFNYTGSSLTVNGPVSVHGSTVSLGQSINSATGGNITLQANTLTFGSGKTVSSTGQLIVTPQTTSNSIGVAGATGSLQITTAHLSTNFTNGFSNIQIGSNSQTGNISTNVFTLQDDMSFLTSGTLTLGGKLIMGSNNVTLGSAISAITGTPSYYFQTNGTGTLSRTIANSASLLFPIGNAYYNPITITNKTGSSDAFSIKVRDDVLEFGTTGSSITKDHVGVTWDINKTNANANSGIDFILQWESTQEKNGISSFALNHFNSTRSAWEFATGTTGSVSGSTTKTISHIGYTGTFSPFAIGNGVSALPVQLLNFDALLQGEDALLSWTTASEINNSGFEIMKSNDGLKWNNIGFVQGRGNSVTPQKYSFIDSNFNSLAYYKLNQIDYNGTITPSPIRILQNAITENEKLNVYPNPSNGSITIITGNNNVSRFELYDAAGRALKNGYISEPQFKITGLTKGAYFLKVYSEVTVESTRIIVE
jgi:autotransporter-associated beta strand protein